MHVDVTEQSTKQNKLFLCEFQMRLLHHLFWGRYLLVPHNHELLHLLDQIPEIFKIFVALNRLLQPILLEVGGL